MRKLAKTLAVLAVAGAAVVAAPMAAEAATYTPGTPTVTGAAAGTVTGSTAPGGTFTVHFNAVFQPRHDLTVFFVSAGAVPESLGDFRAAESPALATTTDGTGAAVVTATMPADASAPVTIEATDGTTTAAITIPVAGVAVAAAAATTGTPSSGLATTGTYVSLATVWGAVGLVVLGAAFLGVRRYGRRRPGEASEARRP